MRYLRFQIKNFKGIKNLVFNLDHKSPKSKIFTLVGLNESGKTTILEALSFFYDNIKDESELSITKAIVDDVHDLIPKGKKDLFNETISISAILQLEDNDIELLKNELRRHGLVYISHMSEISLTVDLQFKDSTFIKKSTLWSTYLIRVKKGKAKEKYLYDYSAEIWQEIINYIKTTIVPAIIYYPDFLFNFPEQITLEAKSGEPKDLIFYRNVLQDILTSINSDLLLKEHILDRYKANENKDREAADAVINKMSGQVTRFLTKSKMSAFNKLLENKEIIIKNPKQSPEGDYYIEIKLKSYDEEYFIKERSLGFRWFFTYLLFTQFRTFRKGTKKLYFLFDEPASNLHQTGQHRLLDAFDELIQDSGNSVVYSTHSHHLVNSKWLESTYIVKNNALDYDDESDYNSQMTDISVLRYREFVGRYPKLLNYFQPILDILEYRPSNLENIPDIVMVEGKNDFYTLEYFNKVAKIGKSINFLPGTGSGSLDQLIQLYYSWGRNFIILLDSDKSGEQQVKRYSDKFGTIVYKKIFTLKDIDLAFTSNELEQIFSPADLLLIQQSAFDDDISFDKYRFNLAMQELLINSRKIAVSEKSKNEIAKIIKFLIRELEI